MAGWFGGGETAAPGQAQQAFQAPTPGAFPAGSASQGTPSYDSGQFSYLGNAAGNGLPGGLGQSGLGGDTGGGFGSTLQNYYNQVKQFGQNQLDQFGNWVTGNDQNYGSTDAFAGTTEGPSQMGNVGATMQDIQAQGDQSGGGQGY